MIKPGETIFGLAEAAEEAGVTTSTLSRWIRQGKLTEDEAHRGLHGGGRWEIDRAALDRVRREQVSRGRGAFKARDLIFYDAPQGWVAVRIEDLSNTNLVATLYDYAAAYDAHLTIVDPDHQRLRRIRAKAFELIVELRKRPAMPDLPDTFQDLYDN